LAGATLLAINNFGQEIKGIVNNLKKKHKIVYYT
jgi:hypothetical protein